MLAMPTFRVMKPSLCFLNSYNPRPKGRSSSFVKIDALKNFAIFTERHLCRSLLLIKSKAFKSAILLKEISARMVS